MQQLHIRLLGEFSLVYGDQPVTEINSARLQSLFAYLLLHSDAPQPRHHLAFLFWPDSTESQALNNLRKALHFLRQKIPDAGRYLITDAKSVQWRMNAPFTLDVQAFESALKPAHDPAQAVDKAQLREHLTQGIALYAGDLLPQCYDDWLIEARERLRDQFMNTLTDLIALHQECGDYGSAIRLAQQRLRLDPLSESAYRQLMQLHIRNGDSSSALRVYHACTSMLQSEFGVSAGELTRQVYEQLIQRGASSAPAMPSQVTSLLETTKLVGRHREWQQLTQAWQAAAHGRTQCFIIAGEAGMGKSRLAEELISWVGQYDTLIAYARAYAAEGALAFSPVAMWLRSDGFRQLWGRVDDVWLAEVSRVLPELRAELPNLSAPQPISGGWQRKQLFEALARIVLAAGRPTLLVLDDLQWCDRETLEWLHFLMRFNPSAPLLLVCTLRLGEVPGAALDAFVLDLRVQQQLTELELAALNSDETNALASFITDKPLAPALAQALYQDTEGNPLFIVEMVRAQRANVSAGELSGNTAALPEKVQAMIRARILQLSPAAQMIANAAAVIGRDFTTDVLSLACEMEISQADFVPALDELWERRIVRAQGTVAYDFSHDRIRDVVLAALSPARRRALHHHVAEALERCHSSHIKAISGQLAMHYEAAGMYDKAVPCYFDAAKAAIQLSAYEDGISHFKHGLKILAAMPTTPAVLAQRVSFLLDLGQALLMVRPGGDLEMSQAFGDACALSLQTGQDITLFRSQRGLWIFHLLKGELKTARQYATKNLAVAQQIGIQAVLGDAERCLAMAEWFMGDVVQASQHMASAISHIPADYVLAHRGVFDDAAGTDALNAGAQMLWQLGFADRALRQSEEGMAFNRAMKMPFAVAGAMEFHAHILVGLNRIDDVHAAGVEMLALAEKYEFSQYLHIGHVILGWAIAAQGKPALGAPMIQQGIDGCLSTGMQSMITLYDAMLAQTQGWLGQYAQAFATLERALNLAERNHEYFWLPELHRMMSDCLLVIGASVGQIETGYWRAIHIAREQSTHAFELRAALSLARWLKSKAHLQEAHAVLTNAYDWFNEGFDTHDLRAARVLLSELQTPH